MATAVLTEFEKNRIRHHMGYLLVSPASSIQLGFPAATQPMFLVERAMNAVPDEAIGIIRAHVARLDTIEEQLDSCRERFAAESLGEIKLRENEADMLEREYVRWAKRLADDLGCPLNPFSERFRGGVGGYQPLNTPVIH